MKLSKKQHQVPCNLKLLLQRLEGEAQAERSTQRKLPLVLEIPDNPYGLVVLGFQQKRFA